MSGVWIPTKCQPAALPVLSQADRSTALHHLLERCLESGLRQPTTEIGHVLHAMRKTILAAGNADFRLFRLGELAGPDPDDDGDRPKRAGRREYARGGQPAARDQSLSLLHGAATQVYSRA